MARLRRRVRAVAYYPDDASPVRWRVPTHLDRRASSVHAAPSASADLVMAEGSGAEPPAGVPTPDETTPFHLEDLPPRQLLGGLFHLLFGRDPVLTPEGAFVKELEDGSLSGRQLAEWLIHSDEWSNRARMSELGPSLHVSRGAFIRLLPPAYRILDLGGTALGVPSGALISMGYPYPFDELVIVDLPSDERNVLYREGQLRDAMAVEGGGMVRYHYHSMTDLSAYASHSFDLVYCGESIEHVTREDAWHVFDQVHRVLRPGGTFALDTPNAAVTRLQQAAFIDPDHDYEYTAPEMEFMLRRCGFRIQHALGLNYAGSCLEASAFSVEEVATRRGVFSEPGSCYLLAYICSRDRMPAPSRIGARLLRRLTRTRPAA
jgi:SAM-dependent methyltransferase